MGDSATTVRYVKNVADAYLKDALKMASENESLSSPIHFIKGSRGERPWTLLKAEAVKNIHNHLALYWPTLRHQEFSKVKELDLVTFKSGQCDTTLLGLRLGLTVASPKLERSGFSEWKRVGQTSYPLLKEGQKI